MTSDIEEIRDWLATWREAYPDDMFPPIDMMEVLKDRDRTYTADETVSIATRNAAAMARHVIDRALARINGEDVGDPVPGDLPGDASELRRRLADAERSLASWKEVALGHSLNSSANWLNRSD